MSLGSDEVLREYPLAESPVETFVTLPGAVFHAVCTVLFVTSCVILPIFLDWFFVGYMVVALTLWASLTAWCRYEASQRSLPEITAFLRTARRTEARVVDRWMQDAGENAPNHMVAYAFTYRGPNGITRRVQVAEQSQSLYNTVAVGDTLTLWYAPGRPERCMRDLPFQQFLARHPRLRAARTSG